MIEFKHHIKVKSGDHLRTDHKRTFKHDYVMEPNFSIVQYENELYDYVISIMDDIKEVTPPEAYYDMLSMLIDYLDEQKEE